LQRKATAYTRRSLEICPIEEKHFPAYIMHDYEKVLAQVLKRGYGKKKATRKLIGKVG